MERVISRLYDIEHEAEAILSRVTEQKENVDKQFKDNKTIFDNELDEKLQSELVALQTQCEEEFNTKKRAIMDNCNAQIDELEYNYSINKQKFIDEIFNRIIQ